MQAQQARAKSRRSAQREERVQRHAWPRSALVIGAPVARRRGGCSTRRPRPRIKTEDHERNNRSPANCSSTVKAARGPYDKASTCIGEPDALRRSQREPPQRLKLARKGCVAPILLRSGVAVAREQQLRDTSSEPSPNITGGARSISRRLYQWGDERRKRARRGDDSGVARPGVGSNSVFLHERACSLRPKPASLEER